MGQYMRLLDPDGRRKSSWVSETLQKNSESMHKTQ